MLTIVRAKLNKSPTFTRYFSNVLFPYSLPDDTIYIIDGTSLSFRAFYTPRSGDHEKLVTSDNFNFHLGNSLMWMLSKFIIELRPKYLAIVFDPPNGSEYRKKIFPEYKQNRPAKHPDLVKQLKLVRPFCEKLGIKCYQESGFEADDVIATMVKVTQNRKLAKCVVVVSGDKDMLQLVSSAAHIKNKAQDDHVPAYILPALSNSALSTAEDVLKKYNVPPEKLGEFLALCGDTADNIPGVDGVGAKAAAALLNSYGSIRGIFTSLNIKDEYTDIDSAVQSVTKCLKEHKTRVSPTAVTNGLVSASLANVELYHQLVTLVQDAPLTTQKMNDGDKSDWLGNNFGYISGMKSFLDEFNESPAVAKRIHLDSKKYIDCTENIAFQNMFNRLRRVLYDQHDYNNPLSDNV